MNPLEQFVNRLKKDGVDHIRISPFAETYLGKVSSLDWRKKFFVPQIGEFQSAICFVNWLVTGDELAKSDPKFKVSKSIKNYRDLCMFAKFYQLCSLRSVLESHMVDLPFVAYNQYQTGIKEYTTKRESPVDVRNMILHILDPKLGPKKEFDWDSINPNLKALVKSYIEKIVPVEVVEKPVAKVVEELPTEKKPKKKKKKKSTVVLNTQTQELDCDESRESVDEFTEKILPSETIEENLEETKED